jgi:hypothetical protein
MASNSPFIATRNTIVIVLLSVIPIDSVVSSLNNTFMSTDVATTGKRDLHEAIARLMKHVRDPDAGKKARDDMDKMREETRKRIGTVEVAVDLVRDARNQ